MTEVTDSWQNVVRAAEQEWPRWREAAASLSPAGEREALHAEARRPRTQEFADSGPPGIIVGHH